MLLLLQIPSQHSLQQQLIKAGKLARGVALVPSIGLVTIVVVASSVDSHTHIDSCGKFRTLPSTHQHTTPEKQLGNRSSFDCWAIKMENQRLRG